MELNTKYLDSLKENKNVMETEKMKEKFIKELQMQISALESEKMKK